MRPSWRACRNSWHEAYPKATTSAICWTPALSSLWVRGLGREPWGEQLLALALEADKPTVIDADGLNLLASRDLRAPAKSVLTPHPGEASRLLGGAPVSDRPAAARDLSARFGNVVVLKGAGSLVAESGELVGICTSGNPDSRPPAAATC